MIWHGQTIHFAHTKCHPLGSGNWTEENPFWQLTWATVWICDISEYSPQSFITSRVTDTNCSCFGFPILLGLFFFGCTSWHRKMREKCGKLKAEGESPGLGPNLHTKA